MGRHHARLFKELLGIGLGNSGVMKEALLVAEAEEDVSREVATRYGRKLEIRFPLSGPGGEKRVVSVWIVEEGSDRPRLVTCYVE